MYIPVNLKFVIGGLNSKELVSLEKEKRIFSVHMPYYEKLVNDRNSKPVIYTQFNVMFDVDFSSISKNVLPSTVASMQQDLENIVYNFLISEERTALKLIKQRELEELFDGEFIKLISISCNDYLSEINDKNEINEYCIPLKDEIYASEYESGPKNA